MAAMRCCTVSGGASEAPTRCCVVVDDDDASLWKCWWPADEDDVDIVVRCSCDRLTRCVRQYFVSSFPYDLKTFSYIKKI